MRPNIRQIEAFNAVMKRGSVTQAAELLFVSQPAVSKMLKGFEASCGFPLFTRAGGRLLPTAEARSLMLETEKLETGILRVENTARQIRQMERGDISVVAYPALSLRALPMFTGRFLREHPNVRMTLHTRNSADTASAILTRIADFGISMVPANDHGVNCRPFVETSLVCVLPAAHPLAQSTAPVDLRDLHGENLVSLSREDKSQQVVVETLTRVGVHMETVMEAQMADSVCSFVSQGFGIALVPQLTSIGWNAQDIVFRPLIQQPRLMMWLHTSAYEPLPKLAENVIGVIHRGIMEMEIPYRL